MVQSSHPQRLLGRSGVVQDARLAKFGTVFAGVRRGTAAQLSPNWLADLPDGGVPMLANDQVGDCVFASFLHWLQLAFAYNGEQVTPTDDEALTAYSANTGYVRGQPDTDRGTITAGPGGAFEFWMRQGITCGGKLNKAMNIVLVNHSDLDELVEALDYGPLLCGGLIRRSNSLSDFMWDVDDSPIDGGHEFIIGNSEAISTGRRYFDVLTWDGLWRATEEWVEAQLDEATLVLNEAFFDKAGLDPGGLDYAALESAMRQLAA